MAQPQPRNFLLFIVLWLGLVLVWFEVSRHIWPPPPPKPDAGPAAGKNEGAPPAPAAKGYAYKAALGVWAVLPKPAPVPSRSASYPSRTEPSRLLWLGRPQKGGDGPNPFHLEAAFDPVGAGVRDLIANKFQQADATGRAVWQDEKTKKLPEPLHLLPADANRETPSFLLYAYDPREPGDEGRPLDTLGRVAWSVVGNRDHPVVEDQVDGRRRQRLTFRAEDQGVTVTKIFTLTEGDYHLGLEVRLARKPGAGDRAVPFRYQLTGGHGLPIEGEWYTGTFRNALIARVEGSSVNRDLQDTRTVALKEGGDAVVRGEKSFLRYAGVVVQFFGSVVAVDDTQPYQDFLQRARPTLETAVARGKVKQVADDHLVLAVSDTQERTFYYDRVLVRETEPKEGARVAVTYHTAGDEADGHLRLLATHLADETRIQPLFTDDVTVRLVTEPVELRPGSAEVSHKYVLYNGPVKPMLLDQMTGAEAVPPAVVERYVHTLHLNTLTDYHSPGWPGSFASAIWWTDLIVWTTNLMHGVLDKLHWLVPNYGVCIILLTVMVRAMMFPVSRKQALTSIRMQQLAPEVKKLQEKYKDDRQALGMAQMDLYRRNGVHPLGTCWMLLLQMPIFMGLYFCLQESVHFRLAPFWPTWIVNLAAPDMLLHWGDKIPWISRPEDYGGFLYLGPYFNLLPIFAVGLQIVTMKMMTPPPTDEQQAAQQKVMKYMMIVIGLMFYKVAAGLCVYFIASSLWGVTERKLLPKKQTAAGPAPDGPAKEGYFQRLMERARGPEAGAAARAAGPRPQGAPAGGRGKRKKDRRRRDEPSPRDNVQPPAEEDASSLGRLAGWWKARRERLREWWGEVLRQAEKR